MHSYFVSIMTFVDLTPAFADTSNLVRLLTFFPWVVIGAKEKKQIKIQGRKLYSKGSLVLHICIIL